MSGVERYLNRATRGLWGQKKRDAVTELRGAIEDKVYRHQLCGLSDVEAERAALRDLGNPAAVARDLNRVHTGPQVTRMTLLLGVTGLLGFQAVAQVNVVRAIPDPRWTVNCRFDDAYLASLPPDTAAATRTQLAQPGGRERLVAQCKADAAASIGNQLLRLADVWAAFRASGVTVQQFPGSAGLYNIAFTATDAPRLLDLSQSVQVVGGEKYVDTLSFMTLLADRTDVPLQIIGTVNPTLTVGPASLRLGTGTAPVRASDVYAGALFRQFELQLGGELGFLLLDSSHLAKSSTFRAVLPEGTHVAVLDNEQFVCAACASGTPRHMVSVQVARDRRVATNVSQESGVPGGRPVMVGTLKEFKAVTAAGRRSLLAYRLNSADLRHVLGDPLPATPLDFPKAAGGK
ncbi:permease prefix domain 1-containing protein [uncultured Deinococcus sp.]|uniref:permease prefix domain 1-containing protein n=1 Tax=uncultured Deinococcus sp. TaxID=158789 RepID=UPI0025CC320A|nr:permease prefix domain 1-containing protein [uncultured Deinococcus sp.]